MDTKPYLEYLDKEMTIMGILSAVSVAAPGGILSAVLASDSGVKAALWNSEQIFVVTASMFCILAAFWFYKERSRLAWLYGQICLTEALADKKSIASETREWLREADSWETWWPYSVGFTFLVTAFVEYLLSLFFLLVPPHWHWLSVHVRSVRLFAYLTCVFLALTSAALQWYVLRRYRFSDDYWSDFCSDVFKRALGKERPHDGVYTRLKPSPIHGVGVFAIRDIPRGTYIFEPDDDKLVSVAASETKSLPANLRRLYEDFCVLKGETYECPSSLNRLTPAWYLNTSKDPNVAADSSLKFYAVRDIAKGEELTADYDAYSGNESSGELK